jgi:hypothetical protein
MRDTPNKVFHDHRTRNGPIAKRNIMNTTAKISLIIVNLLETFNFGHLFLDGLVLPHGS